jgi:hypothetical protein
MPHSYSQSPYLQELAVFAGSQTVYSSAEEYLAKFLRIELSDSTIFRQCNEVGNLIEPSCDSIKTDIYKDETVYVMADGSMILTREDGYKEVKLARIFADDQLAITSSDKAKEPRGYIHNSLYVAHLGSHEDFEEKLHLPLEIIEKVAKEMVILCDGAIWIKDFFQTFYPKATQILDIYHVKEHIADFATLAIDENQRKQWLENQYQKLIESHSDIIIETVQKCQNLTKNAKKLQQNLINYLKNNQFRINYKTYRENGWLIGSGPIESAHRTVIQQRMKLSGQLWTMKKAQNMLNLRTCWLSDQWNTIVKHYKVAA